MLNFRVWLVELTLPEYRDRHIFTARLRIAVFIGFWAIYLYFFRHVLDQTWPITVIISASFVLTAIAYYNVIRDRWLIFSFILELLADLVAITIIVYLSGGPYSKFFTVYVFYCFTAGVFYNYLLAGLLAVCSALFFGLFLLLCHYGIIPPLILDYGNMPPAQAYTPSVHFVFLLIFMVLAVYGVKITSFFSQKRERVLEARNKQLTALHRMSSTIRSAESLKNVIHTILVNVLAGLGFETVILLLIDRASDCVRLFSPGKHPMLDNIVAALGKPVEDISFPISLMNSSPLNGIMKQQIVFRRDVVEATEGIREIVSEKVSQRLQELLKVRKVIGIPLVAEAEVLGAIIGFAKEKVVEDATLETLESFANQAALNIEAARLIEELKNTNVRLTEANRVKSEFLAIMSHELRTPLTAIIGFSELLLEGVMGELSEEQRDSVKEVLNNGADLLEMINSLLDLSKVESGKMVLDPIPFDLNEVIERVQRATSSLIQRKKLKLITEVQKGLPAIQGEERKIQQIMLNLLSNAIKFTQKGGTVAIRINYFKSLSDLQHFEKYSQKIEPKGMEFKNGVVVIHVEDTGVGIKPEHLDLIFDMFQQVDSSMTRSFGGTGLGLALAKKFVDLHQGIIWAESELGKGTSFYVVLPLAL